MHKRWFALILMLAVIPGCPKRGIETEPSEALYETKPRDDLGFSSFYGPEWTVRGLPPDIRDAESFRFLGKKIVIASGYPETCLTLMDGDTFTVEAELTLPAHADAAIMAECITYTDEASRELVVLDSMLKETKRIPLPADCGSTVLSADTQLLYYCAQDGIRVLDLASGTDRPVTEMCFPMQEITGLHCDGSVIGCSVLADDGRRLTLFLSAETGRLLYKAAEEIPLRTEEDLYVTVRMDGACRQLICGSADFGPSVLLTDMQPDAVTPVLSRKLVLLHTRQNSGSWVLDAYHLPTGRHSAQITLPENLQIADIQPDPGRSGLWILCHDSAENRDVLCYWNTDASAPEDSRNYLHPLRSSENPDLAGLEQCRETAVALSESYGVRIRLWTDLPADATHQFEPEYQVPLIRQMLRQLDEALSRYPAGFPEELAEQTAGGKLNICLVRCISPADPPGLLYWDSRGEAYLMLTPTPDLERQIHRLLFDLTDCRVLGISNTYDRWDRADPTGSGHRERIQILEAAISDGRNEFFASAAMQEKLRTVCRGIRESFRTAESADSLPWEQYLADTA